MRLDEIENPAFLKSMNVDELQDLSDEIRQFLIESIAKTGGHLASNLGVVELTVALHYVFDSPRDKIFFDVGHQCYTHKILTGRAKYFDTLRKYRGISGFEKRCESEHDVWEAGHSSTSLSAALGMAVARDLNNEDYSVVPVIGDGAFSSGMALEALNEIGSEKKKVIIVFNDNNMSISKNVGALTKGFSRLRYSKGYTRFKQQTRKNLKGSDLGDAVYAGLKSIKDAFKSGVVDSGVFGEFNLDYLGPVDGHNIRDLILAFQAAKLHEGPIVVHVITTKGKGYGYCEHDTEGLWHGVSPFNVKTGKPLASTPEGCSSWSRLTSSTVKELAESNPDIVALTPAMMNGSALQEFFAKYPDRSFDCGIAEEHAATFAAGLAISGKRPYFAVYSSFLQRCYDQINHDICRMDLPVVIGIDRAGLCGEDGDTHHGVFDIGLLTPLPHMILSEPKDAAECRNLFYTAFAQNHPFAIRFPKDVVKNSSAPFEKVEVGTWTVHHDSEENRVIILTYGENVNRVLNKAEVNDLPYTVVNCRFFKPLDENMLNLIADRNKPVLVYESDMLRGGLSSLILEWCCDHGKMMNLTRMGIGDEYVPQGSVRQLRADLSIDLDSLLKKAEELAV